MSSAPQAQGAPQPLNDAELEHVRKCWDEIRFTYSGGRPQKLVHRLLATIDALQRQHDAVQPDPRLQALRDRIEGVKNAWMAAVASGAPSSMPPYLPLDEIERILDSQPGVQAGVIPLHQAWEGEHSCFWCGLHEKFWSALRLRRCPGHAYGDPLPPYDGAQAVSDAEVEAACNALTREYGGMKHWRVCGEDPERAMKSAITAAAAVRAEAGKAER